MECFKCGWKIFKNGQIALTLNRSTELRHFLYRMLCFSLRLTNCINYGINFSGAMKHNSFINVMRDCAKLYDIMKQALTNKEIEKIQNVCFSNPERACAIAQIIIDTCQVVKCSTYAEVKGKSKRTVLYQKEKLAGIKIENQKFISICS